MAKRNISYIKPQEPAFLTRLKQQAGYVEKDTVDTKRQEMPFFTEEDGEDKEEEQPTVVVLKAGDLTAEEAEFAKAQKLKGRFGHGHCQLILPPNLQAEWLCGDGRCAEQVRRKNQLTMAMAETSC